MHLFDQINNHKYLFLDKLRIVNDRKLILLISEAGNEVGHQQDDKQYRIVFDTYIAFSVINKSYSLEDETGTFIGRIFRVYSKSEFLTYVGNSTIDIEFVIEKGYRHFEFVCLNNIIDVILSEELVIKQL